MNNTERLENIALDSIEIKLIIACHDDMVCVTPEKIEKVKSIIQSHDRERMEEVIEECEKTYGYFEGHHGQERKKNKEGLMGVFNDGYSKACKHIKSRLETNQ